MTSRSDFADLNAALANAAAAIAAAQAAAVVVGADIIPAPPVVTPLVLAPIAPQAGTAGQPISPVSLAVTGGTAPYAYTASAVPGLTLTGNTIAGSPAAAGTDTVSVTATDSSSPAQSVTETFTLTVSPAAVTPPPPPPANSVLFGAYSGNGAAGVAAVKAFGVETNKHMDLISTYCDGTSPASEEQGDWDLSAYKNCGMRLVIGLNVYFGNGNQKADLATGAAGGYNANYKILAQNLIANGQANAILRVGWEEDVNIFSNDDTTSAQNYAKFFQQIRQTMSAVPGANFTYSWYYPSSFDAATINACYPGDTFADCIECDPYDQSWSGVAGAPPYTGGNWTPAQEAAVWTDDEGKRINAQIAFAKLHGKPLCFGEFGVIKRSDNHGGGDDPTWITEIVNVIKNNNFMWVSWFNANSGGDSVLSDFPNSLAAFKAATL